MHASCFPLFRGGPARLLAGGVALPALLACTVMPTVAQAPTGAASSASDSARVDLLSMGAGAFPIRYDDQTQRTLARVVLDGNPGHTAVHPSATGPEQPLILVVELAAPTTFEQFGIPPMSSFGCCRNRHIDRVTVEGSSESPDEGYVELASFQIRADEFQNEQLFDAAEGPAVRWVRISLAGRQVPDPDDYGGTLFSELIGVGTQEARPSVEEEFTGIFLTGGGASGGTGNRIQLVQEGDLVTGCRQSGGASSTISGGVENGILKLTAPDGIPTLLVMNSEGMLRGNEIGRSFVPIIGTPGGAPTSCFQEEAPPNPVGDALDEGRTAIVYGINFDVDSDELRPDAEPALRQILAALSDRPELSVTIEGHTDSDGGDEHNLDLSQRRAEAVSGWLVAEGIDAARLTAVGRGEGEPIADNATDAGRAANRRVEVAGGQ